ncbi:hypothetical protein [Xylanibacter brevis]|uniref:HU family DNA-binding protein n=1 Tax=Xylanibacter brevis TaxID=83231 RepID=UPI00047FDC86|nr:hypothetical protein [Xylanibacter brevis]
MANKRIAMQYDVKQNLVKNSKMFGKWYAQPVINNTLNLKGFAQHIASHNGTYKTSTIKGVIEEMVECLGEMVMQGVGVKLDGLGTFYPTFEGTGSMTLEDYDVNTFVKGIHIRFLPENAKDEELTSRKFMSKCVLKRRFPVSTSTTENED